MGMGAQLTSDHEKSLIRRAYDESLLAAKELRVPDAMAEALIYSAAAKVASRFLGRPVSVDEVRSVIQEGGE